MMTELEPRRVKHKRCSRRSLLLACVGLSLAACVPENPLAAPSEGSEASLSGVLNHEPPNATLSSEPPAAATTNTATATTSPTLSLTSSITPSATPTLTATPAPAVTSNPTCTPTNTFTPTAEPTAAPPTEMPRPIQRVFWSFDSGGQDEGNAERVLDQSQRGTIVLNHLLRRYDISQAETLVGGLMHRGLQPRAVAQGIHPSQCWG